MMNRKRLASLIAAAALVVTGTAAYGLWNSDRTASIVQLDVNPSVELHVDDDGDVLRTEALNPDGEKVLEGMKLKGTDADTAVNAIVGSLLRHGYIDDVANSILLTVEDEDTIRGAKLKEDLTEEINDILNATAINASILSQDMKKDTGLAEKENISEGKATLVENIVEANETYKAEELADLSVNELNLILSNSKNKVDDVKKTGNATDSAYIGREKAMAAALSHAEIKEADARKLEAEMDYEYGVMVYEVEFASGQYEYDYSIDGKSGEVLYSHREYDDDYVASAVKKETTEKADKTDETANEKNNAASETANSKKDTAAETANNKKETTKKDDKKSTSSTTTKKNETSATDIGKDKAKSIALAHAGVKESAVTRLSVEKDYDDGRLEYQVEFHVDNKEYDYEIDAKTGKILDYDMDVEKERTVTGKVTDQNKAESATTAKKETTEVKKETTTAKKEETSTAKKEETKADIGRDKAKSIALSHAGVAESGVKRLSVERDYDDGRIEYSVEFIADGKEYDYEISGESGKILDYDVEAADRD